MRATKHERVLNVLDPQAVAEAVDACDVVVHMAARRTYVPDELEDAARLHVDGASIVAHAAKSRGAKMVLIGTAEEYGPTVSVPYREDARCEPVSGYGQSKLAATLRVLAEAPKTVTVLRPSVIYGANQPGFMLVASCFRGALSDGVIRLRGGQQTRDHVYVEDAARAVVQAVLHHEQVSGQVVNIGSGDERSAQTIAELVIALTGTGRVVLDPPSERAGDVQRMFMATDVASERLRWHAATTLEEGLQKMHSELQKRLPNGDTL